MREKTPPIKKPVAFHKLAVGDKFRGPVSRGVGANSDTMMWKEFTKIDKSRAVCIRQVGYGNNRWVGGIKAYAPNESVWRM